MEVSFESFIILEANLSVEIVYSIWLASGQMLATMYVLELPPIESLRRYVSLFCLYGMWSLFFSDRAITNCSRNERDLLINWASISVLPSEPVFLVRSDPAKSTKFIFDMMTFSLLSTLLLI